MPRLVMLDSGAFSVWNSNAKRAEGDKITIDLDEYIEYCRQHPGYYSYVNLDVIPGTPGKKEGRYLYRGFFTNSCLRHEGVEKAAAEGYRNYRRMIKKLPIEKVIPVFHQDDDVKWLKKYVSESPYVGISPANDRTTKEKLRWLQEIKRYLFHKDGTPIVKTHGFAVTSWRLMCFWRWHSVDSATWVREAGFGRVYWPKWRDGRYDYSHSPWLVGVTQQGLLTGRHGLEHYTKLSNTIRDRFFTFISSHGYTLDDLELTNTRLILNAKFLAQAQKHIPVDHLFFAGTKRAPCVEAEINKRLFSYTHLRKGDNNESEAFRTPR